MTTLFEESRVKSLLLPNRFFRSATWMALAADDGSATEQLRDVWFRLAESEIGLIIAGFSFISPDGKGPPGMAGMHTDAVAESFRPVVEGVHARGGRIAAQIAHCGVKSRPLPGMGDVAGPSEVIRKDGLLEARALEKEEIARIVADFAAAAARARAVGFDAVQLHCAHGYLASQFLSPHYNRRTDEYGGSPQNRLRFLEEMCRGARAAVGADYPLMAKLNGEDFLEGGLTLAEGISAAASLESFGLDLIEVSGGTGDSGRLGPARAVTSSDDEAYFFRQALAIRKAVKIPVAVVGGIRRFEDAERLVDGEGLDYVSLSRPFICEPHLVRRWARGVRMPAHCISCSRCFRTHLRGHGIYCGWREESRKKKKS
jgi:2,4-dienoyl-CoA reductase-like NADH-dependent reductase (Old Yellow Enzyme family)